MEKTSLDLTGLLSESKEYIETKAELWKLRAVDKITEIASSLASRLVIFIVVMIFCIMLSIAIALWIGDWLGKSMYGFFIVAAFYGIAGLILYFYGNKLIKAPLGNKLVQAMLKEDE